MVGFSQFADLPELAPGALDEAVLAGGHFFDCAPAGLALEGIDVLRADAGRTVQVGRFDLDSLVGVVVLVGREFGDGLEGVVALGDLAEDGVFAVEFLHVAGRDVELAAAGFAGGVGGVTEASHAHGAQAVTPFNFRGEGGFESSSTPSGAGAWVFGLRIAHLDEVVGDDSVDGHAVVGVLTDVLLKVGDGERGVGRIKLDSEAAGLAEDVELEDGDVVLEIRDERAVLVGLLLSYEDDFRDFWNHAFHFAHGAAAGEDAAGERDDGSKAGKG